MLSTGQEGREIVADVPVSIVVFCQPFVYWSYAYMVEVYLTRYTTCPLQFWRSEKLFKRGITIPQRLRYEKWK